MFDYVQLAWRWRTLAERGIAGCQTHWMQDPHSEEKIPSLSCQAGVKEQQQHDQVAGIAQPVGKFPHHFRSQDLGSDTTKGLGGGHPRLLEAVPAAIPCPQEPPSVDCFQADAKPKRQGTAAADGGEACSLLGSTTYHTLRSVRPFPLLYTTAP